MTGKQWFSKYTGLPCGWAGLQGARCLPGVVAMLGYGLVSAPIAIAEPARQPDLTTTQLPPSPAHPTNLSTEFVAIDPVDTNNSYRESAPSTLSKDRLTVKNYLLVNMPSRQATDLVVPTQSDEASNAVVFEPQPFRGAPAFDRAEAPHPNWAIAASPVAQFAPRAAHPMAAGAIVAATAPPSEADLNLPFVESPTSLPSGPPAGTAFEATSRFSPSLIAADPANPTLPPILECPNPDPELGCLRIQNFPFPTAPPPVLYLIPRVDFFRSNNLLLGINPVTDGLTRSALTLLAVPPVGRDTYILASVEGAFSRYFKVPIYNYDELRIRAGVLQRLSPTMSAEIGWTNQQLFIANNEIRGFPYGKRFLNDHAIRVELSRRDQLSDRLSLNSIYQFRWGFADPADRSRILNVLFLSLNYDLNPNRTVQAGIDYQFSAANYTSVKRTDIYQQLLGRVTLNAFRNSQLSVYGGVSFGDSTEPTINFNSYVLGVSVAVNLTLF